MKHLPATFYLMGAICGISSISEATSPWAKLALVIGSAGMIYCAIMHLVMLTGHEKP